MEFETIFNCRSSLVPSLLELLKRAGDHHSLFFWWSWPYGGSWLWLRSATRFFISVDFRGGLFLGLRLKSGCWLFSGLVIHLKWVHSANVLNCSEFFLGVTPLIIETLLYRLIMPEDSSAVVSLSPQPSWQLPCLSHFQNRLQFCGVETVQIY
jgi:hypothetical protein